MKKKATQFLADLNGNVDAWYEGRIDYDTFTGRQRATWDAIRAAGGRVEEMVLRGVRDQLPPVRVAAAGNR